jgi:hypothetical protein
MNRFLAVYLPKLGWSYSIVLYVHFSRSITTSKSGGLDRFALAGGKRFPAKTIATLVPFAAAGIRRLPLFHNAIAQHPQNSGKAIALFRCLMSLLLKWVDDGGQLRSILEV